MAGRVVVACCSLIASRWQKSPLTTFRAAHARVIGMGGSRPIVETQAFRRTCIEMSRDLGHCKASSCGRSIDKNRHFPRLFWHVLIVWRDCIVMASSQLSFKADCTYDKDRDNFPVYEFVYHGTSQPDSSRYTTG